VGNVKQLYTISTPPPQDYQSAGTEAWIQRKYLKKHEEPVKDKHNISPDRHVNNHSPRQSQPPPSEEMVYLPAPQRSRSSSIGSRDSPRSRSGSLLIPRSETPPPSPTGITLVSAVPHLQPQQNAFNPNPIQSSGRSSPAPNPFLNVPPASNEPLTPTMGNVAMKAGIMSLYQPAPMQPLQPQAPPQPVMAPLPPQQFQQPPNYNVVVNNPFETHSSFGLIHPHVMQPKPNNLNTNNPPFQQPQYYNQPVYTVAVQPVIYLPVAAPNNPPPAQNFNNSSLI